MFVLLSPVLFRDFAFVKFRRAHQIHFALRTFARFFGNDIEMHGTRVDCPPRCGRRGLFARMHVSSWIGDKLFAALGRTEVVSRARMGRPMFGRFWIDLHSADRIRRGGGSTMVSAMAMVPMLFVVILI